MHAEQTPAASAAADAGAARPGAGAAPLALPDAAVLAEAEAALRRLRAASRRAHAEVREAQRLREAAVYGTYRVPPGTGIQGACEFLALAAADNEHHELAIVVMALPGVDQEAGSDQRSDRVRRRRGG